MDLSALQAAIHQHDRLATTHALREALADNLDIGDIWASLVDSTCEVVERRLSHQSTIALVCSSMRMRYTETNEIGQNRIAN